MPRQPGAKAIVAYKGKMLLILRDNKPTISCPNTWAAPGGAIEPGESPKKALCRELLEEILVIPEDIEQDETVVYDDGDTVYRFFVFPSPEEYEKITLGDEGQCLDWFTYDEAIALDLSPHLRIYLEKEEKKIREALKQSQEEL